MPAGSGRGRWTPTRSTSLPLPDMPLHMCLGSNVVLKARFIVQLGSAHGKNSFRVGSNDPRVRSMKGLVGKRGMQGLIP